LDKKLGVPMTGVNILKNVKKPLKRLKLTKINVACGFNEASQPFLFTLSSNL
jgi:hypothetical protein